MRRRSDRQTASSVFPQPFVQSAPGVCTPAPRPGRRTFRTEPGTSPPPPPLRLDPLLSSLRFLMFLWLPSSCCCCSSEPLSARLLRARTRVCVCVWGYKNIRRPSPRMQLSLSSIFSFLPSKITRRAAGGGGEAAAAALPSSPALSPFIFIYHPYSDKPRPLCAVIG